MAQYARLPLAGRGGLVPLPFAEEQVGYKRLKVFVLLCQGPTGNRVEAGEVLKVNSFRGGLHEH